MTQSHFISLSQAAKATGKSKTTISRYIKNGKISIVSKDASGYQIDPSELFRVLPPVGDTVLQSVTPNVTLTTPTNNEHVTKLEMQLEAAQREITGLKEDKAFLQAELSKTTTLISDMRDKSPQKPVERPKRFLGIFPRPSS